MLRRQKGVERSAEDLAASIAAAHAMLGLNPEPALAQLGISRMALEAIMKQPDPIREAVGAQPPPPENLMHMPLARRPTSFEHAPCSAPGDDSSSAAGQSGQSHTSQPKLRKPPPMGQPPMPPPVRAQDPAPTFAAPHIPPPPKPTLKTALRKSAQSEARKSAKNSVVIKL
jgi:hypothetical protein